MCDLYRKNGKNMPIRPKYRGERHPTIEVTITMIATMVETGAEPYTAASTTANSPRAIV